MNKTARFRQMLESDQLEFLLEAHNGLSARIGEDAGFGGLWASGLCLSAQFGVRDNNEASWTQILEMLEFMADATSVPILLDGDTGYGNFNNVRRLVRKLEQRGVAAVCIEDKLFPKTNSFLEGGAQPLADMDEFCGKIRAGKEAQRDPDFCLIARVEALIAGWGLGEALERATAYHEAGADGILIHSARSGPEEVLAFMSEWGGRAPVVIVPTKYYATPTEVFREAGCSMAIWANHMLRSAVTSMQSTARTIFEEQNLRSVEDRVAPLGELFRLQGASELKAAEERYLPSVVRGARAVVLAASRGVELGELTEQRPKAMVVVRGVPLLSHIVSSYNAVGIKDIMVVRGYAKETITLPNLSFCDNDDYEDTGELISLQRALHADPNDESPLIVSYGDVLFHKYVPQILCESEGDLVIAVDTNWRESANRNRQADYVECSSPHTRDSFFTEVRLARIQDELPQESIHGEWMGFLKISPGALPAVRLVVDQLCSLPENRRAKLPLLLSSLVASGERSVDVLYTTGHWLDIDSVNDVVEAGNF
jgi:phosphoenolpyruvate phosphomutase